MAAMLPSEWEMRFVDWNVGYEADADWAWCGLVIIFAMIIQKTDLRSLIQKGELLRAQLEMLDMSQHTTESYQLVN